jgi:MobA-like NTP transferase domain
LRSCPKFSAYSEMARAIRCGKGKTQSTLLQISPTRRRFQRGDMSPPLKSQIGAVILAAGGSSRFGRPKQLMPLRGKSLIRRIIDAACEARCSPVVVVTGSDGEKVHREIDRASVVRTQNTVAPWDRQFDSLWNSGFDQERARCRGKRVARLRSARGGRVRN